MKVMSVLQSTMSEIRYMKRKNLDEESRIIGNYYSDLIRNYGIDCIYHKLDTKVFGDFKGIIDKNTVLKHAYGQNDSPDYSCSALMVTYPEIHQDVFNLQKYGYVPQSEIDFNFDSKQFACDLATKCGQLKEYKIRDLEVQFIVPNLEDKDKFPYNLDFGDQYQYESGLINGKLSTVIDEYEYDKEYEIICDPYAHSEFKVSFPKNDDLYASLQYQMCNDEHLQSLIFLKFKITQLSASLYVDDEGNTKIATKSLLKGKVHGSILFYDLNAIGKYADMIHPEVGDIVTIDFPDDRNREQYEITDCYDKSLQSDGISPLLHKYIWKCKAKRYANSYEDIGEENEANERLEEKLKYDQVIDEEVAEKISLYDDGDEAAYGGYHGVIKSYDKQSTDVHKAQKYECLEYDQCIDIIRFGVGSRLITNGYDLIFMTCPDGVKNAEGYIVATSSDDNDHQNACFESGLRWLKASKEKVVFVNIEGESMTLAQDEEATKNEIQICLNDLNEKTLDVSITNKNSDNFIKFKESKSYMWATKNHLFVKLESNDKLYKLV